MNHNEYLSTFNQFFEQGSKDVHSRIKGLEQLIEQAISVERGLDIVRSANPDIALDEVYKTLTAADLMYLSLASRLPADVNPLAHPFNVKLRGLQFKVNGKSRNVQYVSPVSTHVQNQLFTIQINKDEVLQECESIFRYFHNRYLGKTKQAASRSFFEMKTGTNIDDLLVTISDRFERPLEDLNENRWGVVFTKSGVLFLDGTSYKYDFIPYTESARKEVEKHLKGFRKYNQKTIPFKTKLETADYIREFMSVLEAVVGRKSRGLPHSQLSPVEQRAFEIESQYGIRINYKKMDVGKKQFFPALSVSDLAVIDEILGLIRGMSGLYIYEIYKGNNPKGYVRTERGATDFVNRKVSRLYSDMLGTGDEALVFRELGRRERLIEILEPELEALKVDFDKYFPVQLAHIARGVFLDLPEERRNEYMAIVEPEIKRQLATLQVFGYNWTKNVFPLSMIDFMKSAIEYQRARIENRPYRLSEPKINFFDALFRPRLSQ